MAQLDTLKILLPDVDLSDTQLQFYLDSASDLICEIRYTDYVETVYLTTQLKIAIELINKIGVEGQTSHGENGLSRSYETSDISPSLLNNIIPYVRTPFSTRRTEVVEE